MSNAIGAIVDAAVSDGPPQVGLSIAVVDSEQTLFTGAYGRSVQAVDGDSPVSVTVDTPFALGSVTKPFTSFLIAQIVESEAFALKQPIREIDPTFRVMDPQATEQMSLEDILCQRTGIPRHDALWYVAGYSADEIWNRAAYLDPNPDFRYQFRKGFQYNNNLYAMLGKLVHQMTGGDWAQELSQRIFQPLNASGLSPGGILLSSGDAKPYLYAGDQVIGLPYKDLTNIAPAGALWGSARGLLPWLRMLASGGSVGGTQPLLSKPAFDDLIHSRVATHASPTEGYGLGWYCDSVSGHRLASHTGNADGYSAWMGFLPDAGYALAVLSNEHTFPGGPDPLATRVAKAVVRRLLGLPAAPGVSPAPLPPAAGGGTVTPLPADSGFLGTWGGIYHHDAYGEIAVVGQNGTATLKYRNNTWQLSKRPGGGCAFRLYAFGARYPVTPLFLSEGGQPVLAVPLEPRVGWTRFRRISS